MTLPSRQLHVRLSPQMLQKFEGLVAEFPAIPKATLLRLLLGSVLEHSQDQIADVVLRQLRKPTGASSKTPARREPMNTKRFSGQ
ncbi:MAG TPA: hypothetical protein VGP72_27050 [Planctomycetota bacterium]|jgi:hypothetical protein